MTRRNSLNYGTKMKNKVRRRSDRALRAPMSSPGRPCIWLREQQQRFWQAIRKGVLTDKAAIASGVSPPVGWRWFRKGGGMPAVSPVMVSKRYLSFAEREEVALLFAQNYGIREIAKQMCRAPSTISREIRRNASTRGGDFCYRSIPAQWHAERRARRPKASKLSQYPALRKYVQSRLSGMLKDINGRSMPGPKSVWNGRRRHGPRQDRRWAQAWSPEQIAHRLTIDFPEDTSMRLSHEAIYQALYIEGREGLQRELATCLRTGRTLRVPRARVRGRKKNFIRPDVMISERPQEADDRATPGHWEGDLIIGLDSSAIGTLVERSSGFTILLHLPPMVGHKKELRAKNSLALAGHGALAIRTAIVDAFKVMPKFLKRSLTWDQGAEMSQHDITRKEIGFPIYFCEPRSPWQRATDENTNGLLR